MTRIEAARRIRVMDQGQQVPIIAIAITASTLASDHALCLEAGMNDFLSKPIDAAALKAALQRRFEEPVDSLDAVKAS